ncbi:hypothetical protein U0070_017221, partial [Myodes glareolus]
MKTQSSFEMACTPEVQDQPQSPLCPHKEQSDGFKHVSCQQGAKTEGFKDTILKAASSLPTPDWHVPPDSSDVSYRQPGDHSNKTSEISSYPPGSCSCCRPQLVGKAVRATADSACHLLLSSSPEPSGFVPPLPSESSQETTWEHLAPSTTPQELRSTLNTLFFSKEQTLIESKCENTATAGDKHHINVVNTKGCSTPNTKYQKASLTTQK